MTDIYVDDIRLEKIQEKDGLYILTFKNKEKDTSLEINVNGDELKNICIQTQNRCEMRDLIPTSNKGRINKREGQ